MKKWKQNIYISIAVDAVLNSWAENHSEKLSEKCAPQFFKSTVSEQGNEQRSRLYKEKKVLR